MNKFNIGDRRSEKGFNGYVEIIHIIEPVDQEVITDLVNSRYTIHADQYYYVVEEHWYDGKIVRYNVYSESGLSLIYGFDDIHEDHPLVSVE